jgi:hypothetical protein
MLVEVVCGSLLRLLVLSNAVLVLVLEASESNEVEALFQGFDPYPR